MRRTEAISIRRMAKEFQCSTTSMYRYFENVEELLYYANLGYLDEYLAELNIHEKEWHDIWDMHIGIRECYCRIAFRYPQAFDIIFFSSASRNLTTAIREYYVAQYSKHTHHTLQIFLSNQTSSKLVYLSIVE